MHEYFSDCDFCLEFGHKPPEGLFQKLASDQFVSRTIFEAGSLRVFPSLGEIMQGHLLIAPTYHVTASVNLKTPDKNILRQIMQKISRAYLREHGEFPVYFEHGDPTGQEIAYGQCVSHAHIHVLPVFVNMLDRLRRERSFIGTADAEGSSFHVTEPYVSFTNGADSLTYYFSAAGAPRQYMRALYSELIGRKGAEDWFSRIELQTTMTSIEKYARILSTVE